MFRTSPYFSKLKNEFRQTEAAGWSKVQVFSSSSGAHLRHTGTHPSRSSQTARLRFLSGSSCSGGTAAHYLDACKAETRLSLRVPTAPRPRQICLGGRRLTCGPAASWPVESGAEEVLGSLLLGAGWAALLYGHHRVGSIDPATTPQIQTFLPPCRSPPWLNRSILPFSDIRSAEKLIYCFKNHSGVHKGGKSNIRLCLFLWVLFPLLFVIRVLLIFLFSWW